MVDFLYTNAPGRLLMKVLQKVRAFVVLAWFLKTPVSKLMVPNYIKIWNNWSDDRNNSWNDYKNM